MVDTHHLLLPGHDTGLGDGGIICHPEKTLRTDVVRPENPVEERRIVVLSHHTDEIHSGSERREIACHVGCPAGIERFPFDLHHGHRGFRGNPIDPSPDEAVEHDIAKHDKAFPGERLQKGLNEGRSGGSVRSHGA